MELADAPLWLKLFPYLKSYMSYTLDHVPFAWIKHRNIVLLESFLSSPEHTLS